uniref:Scaffolding anchor of CK1 domain-containing protein n=1 Tax=Myripristis murdjan TaxID=586833 RepID=A0A667WVR2_9TELE
MSNSQEQSLDEDVVFMPVTESSPAFLHCEKERHAMETLISAGPAAFYSCLTADHLSCFLSPEEVRQIVAWAQEHHGSQLQVRGEENGEDNGPEREEDLSDTYFPTQSDTPAPCLELGWPEKNFWMGQDCITVHTTPPVEGQPHIREIIRRHLQRASQVCKYICQTFRFKGKSSSDHNKEEEGRSIGRAQI